MSLQLLTHCVQQAPAAATCEPTATAGLCGGVGPPSCRHYPLWEEDDDDVEVRARNRCALPNRGSSQRAAVTEATQAQRTAQVTSVVSTRNKKFLDGAIQLLTAEEHGDASPKCSPL